MSEVPPLARTLRELRERNAPRDEFIAAIASQFEWVLNVPPWPSLLPPSPLPSRKTARTERRIRLPSLAKVQRDNPGKTVIVTYRRDGSRSFTVDEKAEQELISDNPWDRVNAAE